MKLLVCTNEKYKNINKYRCIKQSVPCAMLPNLTLQNIQAPASLPSL